jgi:hypothetical protein
MLGDGRAVLIGEHTTKSNKNMIFNLKVQAKLHFQEMVMDVQLRSNVKRIYN